MNERKMSVMQKLRSIRERMAAHEDGDEDGDQNGGFPAVDGPAGDGQGDAGAKPAAPGGTASMWDLVNDSDALGDDDPLPELDEVLPPPASRPKPAAAAVTAVPVPGPKPGPRPVPEPVPESGGESGGESGAGSDPVPQRGTGAAPAAASSPDAASAGVADKPGRRSGRVKTRLLGFDHSTGKTEDVFEKAKDAPVAQGMRFPVGWVVVVEGPGLGTAIALSAGVSQIGRGEDQAIQLDFGDTSISRANHAAIAFDEETRSFFIGHGGKANLVKLNGKPLLSTEELTMGDSIRIGETVLRLVALCGSDFSWADQTDPSDSSSG